MDTLEEERVEAVRRYLSGESAESICEDIGRSERWLYKWLSRYNPSNPEWNKDHSRAPNNISNKTPEEIEETVLRIRDQLKSNCDFYGSLSIQWTMEDLGYKNIPHENTIKKILKRNGRIDLPKSSNSYKPKNIHYPKIETDRKPNILHEMDYLGPRYLEGGYRFYSLNIMDVGTHRVALNITDNQCGDTAVAKLTSSWQRIGIPEYLQMDNAVCLRGSNRYPRAFGKVIRLCLHLKVVPVFIPLSEPWRNGHIEKFHDTFQKMFLRKYYFENPQDLKNRAKDFEQRHNKRYRYSYLKGKSPMQSLKNSNCKINKLPEDFKVPNLKERPKEGLIHVIRFIRSDRVLPIFGEKFTAPKEAVYQYIKAIIDVKKSKLFLKINGKVIDIRDYSYE